LSKEKFDIVLLDIHMPELSGVDVVKKIRKSGDNPNIDTKMLAVTANILESDIKYYLKSGFDGHILKPFREAKLYSKICNMLHIKHGIKNLKPSEKIVEKAESKSGEFEFDTSMLQESAKGNADFYNKMLGVFIVNAEQTANSFSQLLEKQQWAEIGEKAHKALPSFKYFGLHKQVETLTEIENLALRKKKYEKIPSLVEQSIADISSLIPQVKEAKLPENIK
jgi:CheY-like chemotaxis protein